MEQRGSGEACDAGVIVAVMGVVSSVSAGGEESGCVRDLTVALSRAESSTPRVIPSVLSLWGHPDLAAGGAGPRGRGGSGLQAGERRGTEESGYGGEGGPGGRFTAARPRPFGIFLAAARGPAGGRIGGGGSFEVSGGVRRVLWGPRLILFVFWGWGLGGKNMRGLGEGCQWPVGAGGGGLSGGERRKNGVWGPWEDWGKGGRVRP